MKDQRKTEIKVGITVIISVIILLWIFGWAKNITVNSGRKEVNVMFDNVAALEIGDPAAVNGVRKGYVDDIQIDGAKVFVKINLDADVTLKEDAQFYIMMLDLMGGKKVEISPGSSSKELDYSATQKGEFKGDIASAMAVFGSVEKDLVDVIKEVKITLTAVNSTLTDQQFNSDLKTSVNNLSLLTENLNKLIMQNKDEINKLLNSGIELSNSVNNFIKTNQDSISQTITSLKQTLEQSKTLIAKVNELLDKTNNSENNLGKFLNDPEMMSDIKASIQKLKELTQLLVDQLKNEGLKVKADVDLF